METRRQFDPDEDKWKSKAYYLKLGNKKFFVAKFLFKLRKLPNRNMRFLFLWMKDIMTPGNPVIYAQFCLADFTTYLKRHIRESTEWKSRPIRAIHKGHLVGKFQLFLLKKEKPDFVLKFTEKTDLDRVSYYTRLSLSDFQELHECVLTLGGPPRYRGNINK